MWIRCPECEMRVYYLGTLNLPGSVSSAEGSYLVALWGSVRKGKWKLLTYSYVIFIFKKTKNKQKNPDTSFPILESRTMRNSKTWHQISFQILNSYVTWLIFNLTGLQFSKHKVNMRLILSTSPGTNNLKGLKHVLSYQNNHVKL